MTTSVGASCIHLHNQAVLLANNNVVSMAAYHCNVEFYVDENCRIDLET